jgi:hypothetical protein
MAILDGLKNAVAANVARSANNVAVNGLRSIAGNVFGVDLNPTNPAAQLTNRPTRFTTTMLQYPANVVGDDMQGHYIIFEILVQDKAKLKADQNVRKKKIFLDQDSTDRAATLASNTAAQAAVTAAEKAAEKIAGHAYHNATRSGGGGESGIISLSGDGNSLQLSKKAAAFTATQIALYMPPSLSVSYNSKYGPSNISAMGMMGKTALDAFMGKNGTNFDTALEKGLGEFKQGAETAVMAILDTAAPGSTALLALEKGAIRTPRMELMFEGIGRREFSFEFNFIPKDANEATTIQNIVKQFKLHMASNFTDETFREMEIPDLFNIKYMFKGDENQYLNKISTCALESMDVSYGGDRFVAVGEDGVPQTTKITLKFKEMEIITKKAIQAGA